MVRGYSLCGVVWHSILRVNEEGEEVCEGLVEPPLGELGEDQ